MERAGLWVRPHHADVHRPGLNSPCCPDPTHSLQISSLPDKRPGAGISSRFELGIVQFLAIGCERVPPLGLVSAFSPGRAGMLTLPRSTGMSILGLSCQPLCPPLPSCLPFQAGHLAEHQHVAGQFPELLEAEACVGQGLPCRLLGSLYLSLAQWGSLSTSIGHPDSGPFSLGPFSHFEP